MGLHVAQTFGSKGQRLVALDLLPGLVDVVTNHRLGDAVFVRGIAKGEAALDATVAVVGVTALVRDHANQLVALHFGFEAAADAAIGTGGDLGMLRHAVLDHAVFHQGRGRAGLDTGATTDALRVHKVLAPGADLGIKAAAIDGQGEGALDFAAGPHTAAAHDAFAGIKGEVGVGLVFLGGQMVLALKPVAHFAQSHGAGHVLQFAVAVGRTGQAVQRVIRDVQLHHVASQLGDVAILGGDLHAVLDRGGAAGGHAPAAFYLDRTQPARAKGL